MKPGSQHASFPCWSAVALLLLTTGSATARDDAPAASDIVGTWEVVRIVDTDPTGKVSHPYGEKPKGFIVYDATGHLHVQVMRTPATPRFASGDDARGTDAEVRAAYDGYVAYFGTYSVDARKGVVVHHVDGSLMPGYTGTDQPRPFTVRGDTLAIEVRNADGRFYRELRRVK